MEERSLWQATGMSWLLKGNKLNGKVESGSAESGITGKGSDVQFDSTTWFQYDRRLLSCRLIHVRVILSVPCRRGRFTEGGSKGACCRVVESDKRLNSQ